MKNYSKGKPKPDAVFCCQRQDNDACVFGVLKNLKPKRNIGLTGFTNTKVGDLFDPPLTVVKQPAFDIGQTATELLIQMIESKRPVTEFETKILDTELIIRESSLKKVEA